MSTASEGSTVDPTVFQPQPNAFAFNTFEMDYQPQTPMMPSPLVYPMSNRDTYSGQNQIILPPPTGMDTSSTSSFPPFTPSYQLQRAAIPSQWGPSSSSASLAPVSNSVSNLGQGWPSQNSLSLPMMQKVRPVMQNMSHSFEFSQQPSSHFGQLTPASSMADVQVKAEPEDPMPFGFGMMQRQSSRPQWQASTTGLVVGGTPSYLQHIHSQSSPMQSGQSTPYTPSHPLPTNPFSATDNFAPSGHWNGGKTITSRSYAFQSDDAYEPKTYSGSSLQGYNGLDNPSQGVYPHVSTVDFALPAPSSIESSPFLFKGEDWAPSPMNGLPGHAGAGGWTTDDSYDSYAGQDSSADELTSWDGDLQAYDGEDVYGAVNDSQGEPIDGQKEAEAFDRAYSDLSGSSSKSPYGHHGTGSSRSSSEDSQGLVIVHLTPGKYENDHQEEESEGKAKRRAALNAMKRRRAIPNERIPAPIPDVGLTKKTRGRTVTTSPSEVPSNVVHVCPIPNCGACFRRREHVKRHIRGIHTHEKPFACTFTGCDKRFSRRDNRMTHVMKAHKAVIAGTIPS